MYMELYIVDVLLQMMGNMFVVIVGKNLIVVEELVDIWLIALIIQIRRNTMKCTRDKEENSQKNMQGERYIYQLCLTSTLLKPAKKSLPNVLNKS